MDGGKTGMSHCRSQLWWIAQTICLGGRLAWATPGQDTSWLAQSLTGLGHCCCPPGEGHRLAGWRHGTHGSRQMDGWTGGSLAGVRAGQTHVEGKTCQMEGQLSWVTVGHQTGGGHKLVGWMAGRPGSLQVAHLIQSTGWLNGCLASLVTAGHCR